MVPSIPLFPPSSGMHVCGRSCEKIAKLCDVLLGRNGSISTAFLASLEALRCLCLFFQIGQSSTQAVCITYIPSSAGRIRTYITGATLTLPLSYSKPIGLTGFEPKPPGTCFVCAPRRSTLELQTDIRRDVFNESIPPSVKGQDLHLTWQLPGVWLPRSFHSRRYTRLSILTDLTLSDPRFCTVSTGSQIDKS